MNAIAKKSNHMESIFNSLTSEDLKKELTISYMCAQTNLLLRSFYERHYSAKDKQFVKLFIDANGLKRINDVKGHKAGDEYLSKIAAISQRFTRPSDILVRWGGDEFVLFVKTNDEDTVHLVKERLEQALKTEEVSAALGVGKTVEEADKNMYKDKFKKKNVAYKTKILFRILKRAMLSSSNK